MQMEKELEERWQSIKKSNDYSATSNTKGLKNALETPETIKLGTSSFGGAMGNLKNSAISKAGGDDDTRSNLMQSSLRGIIFGQESISSKVDKENS